MASKKKISATVYDRQFGAVTVTRTTHNSYPFAVVHVGSGGGAWASFHYTAEAAHRTATSRGGKVVRTDEPSDVYLPAEQWNPAPPRDVLRQRADDNAAALAEVRRDRAARGADRAVAAEVLGEPPRRPLDALIEWTAD